MMRVDLSPELEGFIKASVEAGSYADATEVIREDLRRKQADETRRACWRAAIAQGNAELARGEGIAYTPTVLQEITERALRDDGAS